MARAARPERLRDPCGPEGRPYPAGAPLRGPPRGGRHEHARPLPRVPPRLRRHRRGREHAALRGRHQRRRRGGVRRDRRQGAQRPLRVPLQGRNRPGAAQAACGRGRRREARPDREGGPHRRQEVARLALRREVQREEAPRHDPRPPVRRAHPAGREGPRPRRGRARLGGEVNFSPRDVLSVPGRLSINPASLTSGSYPWGGTGLGLVREIVAMPRQRNYAIRAEEYGMVPVEAIQAAEAWMVVGILASHDDDALKKLFMSGATGTTTQRTLVTAPGTVGSRVSDRAVALLFTPEDTDRHDFLLLYKALPLVDEAAQIRFSGKDPQEIAVAFEAIYDGSNRLAAWGKRHDISL